MAVPGSVLGGRNRGGHALIRDGAKIVEAADDIVGELRHLPGWNAVGSAEANVAAPTAYGHEVLGHMSVGQLYVFDELAAVRPGGTGASGRAERARAVGQSAPVAGGGFLRVS